MIFKFYEKEKRILLWKKGKESKEKEEKKQNKEKKALKLFFPWIKL